MPIRIRSLASSSIVTSNDVLCAVIAAGGSDFRNRASQGLIFICVQRHLHHIADSQFGKILFIHRADKTHRVFRAIRRQNSILGRLFTAHRRKR